MYWVLHHVDDVLLVHLCDSASVQSHMASQTQCKHYCKTREDIYRIAYKRNRAMPQLDKTTFLSQFFWLLFFYIGLYLVILKHFLPRLSRILKVRQRRVSLSQQGTSALLEEREKVEGSLNTLVEQGVRVSKGLFQENLQATHQWLDQVVSDSNRTTLRDANQSYVATLGENTISQNVAVDITFPTISGKGFALALTEKIKSSKFSQL